MTKLGEVHIRHAAYDIEAGIRVSYDPDPLKHNGAFVSTATVVVETGAAAIHAYATADRLRALAALFTEAAKQVDAGVAAAAAPEAA